MRGRDNGSTGGTRRRRWGTAGIAALAVAAVWTPSAGAAQPPFRVGTGVVDITPTTPMAPGGYGTGYLVTGGAHDPLQVRAFLVGSGKSAVAFVSVDSQGWFAGVQAPNAKDGAIDARADAAAVLKKAGYKAGDANVIVSSTHDHAAPTLMGIWGHTEPAYLRRVHAATVEAVRKAVRSARTAELWSATGTIDGLVSEVQGTDQIAGFAVDTQVPILWAREPGTGATIGTYATVPVHVDQYNPTKTGNNQWTADYPGWVRDTLGTTLGGTSVVAMGTLGRQEGIGDTPDYPEVTVQGQFVANAIARALTTARRIDDRTVSAATKLFSVPADNGVLIAAMTCNHGGVAGVCDTAPNDQGTWLLEAFDVFTINRSLASPFRDAAANTVSTYATTARIGDQVFTTAPGEAFPEVAAAIRRSLSKVKGVRTVHVINHAMDQLGYYWDQRPGIYSEEQLDGSDFSEFNTSPKLAQANVDAVRAAGAAIGLKGTSQNAFAQVDDPAAFGKPAVQFYPGRVEGTERTVSLYGTARAPEQKGSASTSVGSSAATPTDDRIAWDFGDGTTESRPNGKRFDHTFPKAGTFTVTATAVDNLGQVVTWKAPVTIDPPLSAGVRRVARGGRLVLTATARGGQGRLLAARWRFSDGGKAAGVRVTRAVPRRAVTATVTVTDGAGNTATTTARIPAGG